MLKKRKILALIWFMMLSALIFFSLEESILAQSWYNPSWGYRKSVTVNNTSNPNPLTNYQVKVALTSSNFNFSKAQSGGQDIRFTASDGTTLIDHWIESWNSVAQTATLWAEVPSVPGSGTTLINMYFGNPGASTASNGDATFQFFDDFETELPPIWTEKQPLPSPEGLGSAAVHNNILYVFGGKYLGANKDETYAYDPSSNTWTELANMPNACQEPIAVTCGDSIHIFAKADGGGHQIYLPETNTWYSTTPEISNPVIELGNPGYFNERCNADPDFLYVSDYGKWFMVWTGGDFSGNVVIALAYSSDGKNWVEYDGVPLNGNSNPVILSGLDTDADLWESSGGNSKIMEPTLLYEGGTFHLYYKGTPAGNNRGQLGFATFTWDNVSNNIENLERYTGNPTVNLPADIDFKSGCGHIDISKHPVSGLYYLYVVREELASLSYELALLTSPDMISWTNQGKVLARGAPGEWDNQYIYRSSPVTDTTGNIVLFDNKIRIYYSGYSGGVPRIGFADIPATGPPEKYAGNPLNLPQYGASGVVHPDIMYFPAAKDGYLYWLVYTPYPPDSKENPSIIRSNDGIAWTVGGGGGPAPVPDSLVQEQGGMGVKYGNKIHLFGRRYHYEYDPSTDTYTRKADVPTWRTWGTCAVVDSLIYVIGGHNWNPHGTTNVNEAYNPSTDSWTTKAPMPIGKYAMTRENPVIDGKIYSTHGAITSTDAYANNYVYDPSTNTWETKTSGMHPRKALACGVIDNRLYVVGGMDAYTDGMDYVEAYDPLGDVPGLSAWVVSNPNIIKTDAMAKYEGEKGLLFDKSTTGTVQSAIHYHNFASCAVDLYWEITDFYGLASIQPYGSVEFREYSAPYGNLHFYNDAGTPKMRWFYNGAWTTIQNCSWNTWYKVTFVWNGPNSKVIVNGTEYSVSAPAVNSDRIALEVFNLTREYFDLVRVRNYASPEPSATLGPSESAGQVSLIPGFQVDKPNDLDTVWVHLDNNLAGVEIATFKVTYDENYLTPTTVIDGPDLPLSHLVQYHIYPQDSILIDIGILEGHFDGPGSLVGIVLTADALVDATHLDFARSILRDSSNQDIVHTTQGASIQIKDLTPPTVSVTSPVSGDTINYRPTLTVVFHDDLGLNRGYYQIDGCTGGAWTSLWSYNSGSSDTIINWTVPSISQGSHSIHFKVTDDGGNVNVDSCSYSWVFTYDSIPPAAPTGFAVLPGHKKCKLSWTNPPGSDFRGVEVRRNPWCSYAYPEYDDTCAAIGYPATHTQGDSVYRGSGTSFKDSSSTLPRNVYYYTIFSYDRAGNYSAATTAQQGRGTNYWLGDVSGEGEVYFEDLGVFSNTFWTTHSDPHYDAEFDIGPTSNMSPKGIPTTDNVINFEDLVIFAINFAKVGPNQKAVPILAGQDITGPLGLSLVMPEGGLQVGREFKLKVVLSNNPGTVKAIHFVLPYDPAQLEFIGVDQSAELKGASYPLFFDGRERGQQVDVSLALLGGNTAIGGSGQIASISFRLLQSKDLSLGFSQIDLRDGENNKLSGQGGNAEYTAILQVPKAYGLSQNYPNPYNIQTQIAYQLPKAGMVLLKIYNIRGELVRTLVNEHKPAGYHTVTWDGKNGDGVAVSSGIYFYRLSSESFSATRKMVMIK